MAEIANLRLARKRKQREADRSAADANRLKHGRSKAQRALDDAAERRLHALLDGAKREKE